MSCRYAGIESSGAGLCVKVFRAVALVVLGFGGWVRAEDVSEVAAPAKEAFYTRQSVFSTQPSSQTTLMQSIDRFGPVGIGIELHPPAFVMKVKNVEPGSPAEVAGKLKAGQIIETINGQKLHDIDPRIQLGNVITEAEAKDGKVVFAVRDTETAPIQEVTVEIPVLGAYSDTWPLNCPKSDKIVRNLADQFIKEGWNGDIGLNGPKMMFLLSTGDEKDLEAVRGWIKTTVEKNQHYGEGAQVYAWFVGWGAPPLAEYYLRTGDASVLPLMQKIADAVRKTMYHDGWGGRGMAGHHMGLAGTSTLTFLLLARQCGVEVDEAMLQTALKHYYRFAGKGTNPYMDAHPETSFTDNGRNGLLAFAMSAASALLPDKTNDVYENARDIAAMHSFYSASYMLHGHTGGGIGEVWRSAAMGLMYERKPQQYRDFMKERIWWYDMSRRYDGSFGILGGEGYDKTSWGITIGLTYTGPRKKLCIYGAPRSKYAQYYKIPERPWGTDADNDFLKIEAAADKEGKVRNLDQERIATDAAVAFHRKLGQVKFSDQEVIELARHPQHLYRTCASDIIYSSKLFKLIPELLKDKDARVRYVGVSAIKLPVVSSRPERCDPGFPMEEMTDEVASILGDMLNNPEESWFVLDQVVRLLGRRTAEQLAPHAERIAGLIGHEEQWVRHAALEAVVPLAVDKRYYKQVLPAIEKHVPNFVRAPKALDKLAASLADADPEVQKACLEAMSRVYLAYPGKNANPPGGLHPESERWYLDALAASIASVPGGLDKLYEISRERFPRNALSHRGSFLPSVGSSELSSDLNKAITAVIMSDLIPEFVAQNRKQLLSEAAWDKSARDGQFAVGVLGGSGMRQGLSDLYSQAGIKDYEWHSFGPARDEVKWDYYSFDPEEKQLWESPEPRYRKVTLPAGMEKWYEPGFDAKKAGWKSGNAPFACVDGKLPEAAGGCKMSICGCGEPPKTLWENEVLLMRGTFDLPPLDSTKRYRLLIGGRSHVGSGDGLAIYLNGQLINEQAGGTGRRAGAQPCGLFIDKELAKKFGEGGKVEIAVKAFMGKHPRSKEKKAFITIFFEEMTVPPIKDIMSASAKAAPLLAAAWQALQYPDVEPDNPDEGKFRYDGKFVANKQVTGDWMVIDQVAKVDEFVPGKKAAKLDPKRVPFRELSLKENGDTGNVLLIWSGDMLMDLDMGQALAMTVKTIGDAEYLFVEAGGFDAKNGPEWKSPLLVLKRK